MLEHKLTALVFLIFSTIAMLPKTFPSAMMLISIIMAMITIIAVYEAWKMHVQLKEVRDKRFVPNCCTQCPSSANTCVSVTSGSERIESDEEHNIFVQNRSGLCPSCIFGRCRVSHSICGSVESLLRTKVRRKCHVMGTALSRIHNICV